MNVRNEIKAQIVRTGFTMQEVVDLLHDEYGCLPNCKGRASATRRSWNWLMRWGMTSYGRNGGRDK